MKHMLDNSGYEEVAVSYPPLSLKGDHGIMGSWEISRPSISSINTHPKTFFKAKQYHNYTPLHNQNTWQIYIP
jgi:hypothetical protein